MSARREAGPPGPDGGAAVATGLGALLRWAVRIAAAALALALLPGAPADAAAAAGVAVLLSAPYLVTLTVAAHYARRRRWTEAALAALLLALLLAGLWLGTGRGA